jgi:hypothetical protein
VVCDGIHQLDEIPVQVLDVSKEDGDLVPVLTCLDDARCRKHWWFED